MSSETIREQIPAITDWEKRKQIKRVSLIIAFGIVAAVCYFAAKVPAFIEGQTGWAMSAAAVVPVLGVFVVFFLWPVLEYVLDFKEDKFAAEFEIVAEWKEIEAFPDAHAWFVELLQLQGRRVLRSQLTQFAEIRSQKRARENRKRSDDAAKTELDRLLCQSAADKLSD